MNEFEWLLRREGDSVIPVVRSLDISGRDQGDIESTKEEVFHLNPVEWIRLDELAFDQVQAYASEMCGLLVDHAYECLFSYDMSFSQEHLE